MSTLSQLPSGSLGYCYAQHIQRENLDQDFYPKIKVCDDGSYLAMRSRQTHDIWHVVTGFGTDGLGETQLQAFSLAQTRIPIAAAILASSVWKILLHMPEPE